MSEYAGERKDIGKRAYDEFLRIGISAEAFSRKYGMDSRCVGRWRKANAPSAYALRCLVSEGADVDFILFGKED